MVLNMVNDSSIETHPYKAQAQLLKVLTHPVRIAILNILRDGENCVCHMEAHTGYRQAYISQQLMVLREAGLIQDRRDGWNIYYRVTEPRIFAVLTAVEQIIAPENSNPSHRPAVVCPCPKCNPG
jgi:DNA-binding transcriptional ArsR family regulator